MTERQLTVKEFCRRYGVGVTTTYKLLGEGAIMAVRYGHRTLIDVESAEAWRKSLPAFLPPTVPTIQARNEAHNGERRRMTSRAQASDG